MAALSRYYPTEAAAILAAAKETAAAKGWPSYLVDSVPAFFGLADDRAEQAVNGGTPGRGDYLAALAALWIAELKEEPAPGWLAVGGYIGDSANLALRDDWKTRQEGSAFAQVWGDVRKAFLFAADAAGEAAKQAGSWIGGGLTLALGIGAIALFTQLRRN